jgi:hypothetical protein
MAYLQLNPGEGEQEHLPRSYPSGGPGAREKPFFNHAAAGERQQQAKAAGLLD